MKLLSDWSVSVLVGAAVFTGVLPHAAENFLNKPKASVLRGVEFPQYTPLNYPPVQAFVPPSSLAWRDALGYGRETLGYCREMVYYGPDGIHGNADDWPLVVHIVDPDTYDGYSDDPGGIQDILRNDVADDQYDIVLFVQSGMVNIIDNDGEVPNVDRYYVSIENSCVYVSGILAPGDGPPVMRAPFTDRDAKIRLNDTNAQKMDIVLRDSRLWSDSGGSGSQVPAFNPRQVNRYIVDHFERLFGQDQDGIRAATSTAGLYQADGTLSYNIFGPTNTWPSGGTSHLVTMKVEDGGDSLTRISEIRNYFPCGTYRCPKGSAATTSADTAARGRYWEFINNLSHHFGNTNRIAGEQGATHIDWIGNFIQYGRNEAIGNGFQPIEGRRCDSSFGSGTGLEWYASSTYMSGNEFWDSGGLAATDWDMLYIHDRSPYFFNCGRGGSLVPDSLRRAQRIQHPDTTTAWPASEVPDSLLNGSLKVQVGPRGVTCGGTLRNVRNTSVAKLIAYAENNTYLGALYADSLDAGWGWLGRDSLLAGTICTDTDQDGLTDAFETWTGISDPDSLIGGFFAIEHLLNGDSAYLAGLLAGDPLPQPPHGGTFLNVFGDTVRVRLLAAKESVPHFAAPDTYPLITDEDSLPDDATRDVFVLFENASPVTSALAFTCDISTEGGAIIDSLVLVSSLISMGFDPAAILAIRFPGCE